MITRSRSRQNKHIHHNTNKLNNMNTETATIHNSEMGFDVNNQLGDPKTLAQITMENQDSGTRVQDNGETETQQITPETLKAVSYTHLDVYKRQLLHYPNSNRVLP